MITIYDIIYLCQKYNIPLVGVYSKNRIPKKIIDGNYIINMQDDEDKNGNNLPGTHWVAFTTENNKVNYFDSFGFGPPSIVRMMLKKYYFEKNKPDFLAYSMTQIQNINSGVCGWYCVYFCYFMDKYKDKHKNLGYRLQAFLNKFDEDTEKNREILKKELAKIKEVN